MQSVETGLSLLGTALQNKKHWKTLNVERFKIKLLDSVKNNNEFYINTNRNVLEEVIMDNDR
jgi:hypothetical protein